MSTAKWTSIQKRSRIDATLVQSFNEKGCLQVWGADALRASPTVHWKMQAMFSHPNSVLKVLPSPPINWYYETPVSSNNLVYLHPLLHHCGVLLHPKVAYRPISSGPLENALTIHSGAQYVTLQKYFSHPSFNYFFCNPTQKTETETANR